METRVIAMATSNKHKVDEINSVLAKCGYQVEPVSTPKIEVQSDSLEEVATLAAATAYHILHKPVIVEDAGLFVEALNGFPGPFSSYVYKTIGINGLLKLLEGETNRRAFFKSVIALAWRNGVRIFEGVVQGTISLEPRGEKGFGFDPVFIPRGFSRTFAEMSTEEKSKLSHRGMAARKLCEWLTRVDQLA